MYFDYRIYDEDESILIWQNNLPEATSGYMSLRYMGDYFTAWIPYLGKGDQLLAYGYIKCNKRYFKLQVGNRTASNRYYYQGSCYTPWHMETVPRYKARINEWKGTVNYC